MTFRNGNHKPNDLAGSLFAAAGLTLDEAWQRVVRQYRLAPEAAKANLISVKADEEQSDDFGTNGGVIVRTNGVIMLQGIIAGESFWRESIISATGLQQALDGVAGDVKIYINSPGGSVFEGQALRAVIEARKDGVSATAQGVCASAATLPFFAADSRYIAEGSMLMIHNAWSWAVGNAKDMAKAAELLAKIDGEIIALYESKTEKSKAEISALMEEETFFTAAEAEEAGFGQMVGAEEMPEEDTGEESARAAAIDQAAAAMRPLQLTRLAAALY